MKRFGATTGNSFSPELNNCSSAAAGENSTIEQAAKHPRRGRPVGSRNKPKPPVIITFDPPTRSAFRTHVLEIPSGRDAAKALAAFAGGLGGDGLCVLAGYGSVSSATIRQPSQSPTAVIFHGCFDLVSLSAVFLPGGGSTMTVSLVSPQGQVMGVVAGPLVAAGTMMVVAAAFTVPEFHRLPEKDGDDDSGSCSGSLSDCGGEAEEKRDGRRHMYFQGIPMQTDDDEGAAVLGGTQFGNGGGAQFGNGGVAQFGNGGGAQFENDGAWVPTTAPPIIN